MNNSALLEYIIEDERIFANGKDGKILAEITFKTKDGIATIDHTFVDESLRGQGVAGQLMRAAVEKIQSDGNKIAATCSYAASWLSKHPEVSHVDAGNPVACKIGGRH